MRSGAGPPEVEDVGGLFPCPEGTLCCTGASAGWGGVGGGGGAGGLRTHVAQTRSILGGRLWLNDRVTTSPSQSSFFMVSELQKQKLLTLSLKLFVTCAKDTVSTAFCLGSTWVNMPRRLAQKSFQMSFLSLYNFAP